MRIILQRVTEASVTTVEDGKLISSIGKGILLLLGLTETDNEEMISKYVGKCLKARLWSQICQQTEQEEESKVDNKEENANSRWRSNVMDNDYEIIVVSQFTLYGSLKYGNKPQFDKAMAAEKAKLLYELFIEKMKEQYKAEKVFGGAFQQHMNVKIMNDGPVTIILEEEASKESQKKLEKLEKQKEIQKKTEQNKMLKKEKEEFKKWLKENSLKYESKEQYEQFFAKFRDEKQGKKTEEEVKKE